MSIPRERPRSPQMNDVAMSRSKRIWRAIFGYPVTAASVIVWTAGLLAIEPRFPLGDFPIVFLVPVVLAAYLFGTGPAVFACAFGFVLFYYYFAAPMHAFVAPTSETWPSLAAFAICAALVIPAITMSRRGRQQAEQSARELQASEQALRRSQEHAERHAAELESFFASMVDGAAIFDAEGKPVMANDAAKRIFGVPPGVPFDEWSTAYRLQTVDGEPIPDEDYPSRRALRGEAVANTRYRLVTTWTEAIISATVSPVRDVEDKIVGVVAVFRNVKEEVEFEVRREQLYEREHHIAELLQEALIPQVEYQVPGWKIAVRYQPALDEARVGGDFYDVFDLGDGKVGVLIGDVAGKGLRAAMGVAAVRHSVRSYAYLEPNPAMVMTLTNQALIRYYPDGDALMTAFFAVLGIREGTMHYTNAGHEPPILLNSARDPQEIGVYDPALGFLEVAAYSETCLSIGAGDTVVMMTDGITEARQARGSLFGKDRVIAWLREHPGATLDEIADGLLEAARSYAGGELRDDAAVLIFSAESGTA